MVELAGIAAGGGGHVPFRIWPRGQPKWSPNLGGGDGKASGAGPREDTPTPPGSGFPQPHRSRGTPGGRGALRSRGGKPGGSAGGSRPAPWGGVKGTWFPRGALQVSGRSRCSPARAAGEGGRCGGHPGSRGGACLGFVCLFVCCVASPLF